MTEDLSVFFADFAVAAVYNSGATVNVIFDNAYHEIGIGDVGSESAKPTALGLATDFASASHGDTLLISGVTYTVIGVERDGSGLVVLVLKKP